MQIQRGITRELEDSLRRGRPTIPVEQLLVHARRNKMLLHALRGLNVEGPVRLLEEAKYTRFLEALEETARVLRDTDYCLFKVVRPVEYVPADIDVLLARGEVRKVIPRFERIGVRPRVKDMYCITLTGRFTVDLYTYPNFGNVIYQNTTDLLKYKTETKLDGIAIASLRRGAEAAIVIAHAIYKEQIFTLNDKMTIEAWFDAETRTILEEAKSTEAYEFLRTVSRKVEEGLLDTPYRVPSVTALSLLARKVRHDRLTRSTLLKSASRFFSRDVSTKVTTRLKRISY